MDKVDIKDISGTLLLTPSLKGGSKRKFLLMKEDYITLKFSLESPVHFKLGDYVDCGFGLFEVCDLQRPAYNTSTGGYDYDLRLDAYYWKWKNKIFKYTPEAAGREASWSLTASLDVHAGVVLRNLKALGYTYKGQDFDFSIDSSVEDKSLPMSYDNINILDACFEMAKKWDCECWVTENIIHFGRLEHSDPVDFEIGVNVEDMTRSDSQSNYATRIYAFGSTRNIPANYRPVDESVVVNGVVQRRLMLPVGTPYLDAYPEMRTEEAVEQVVIFDDIYPRRVGTMSGVTTHEYTDKIEEEGKEPVYRKWNAYRFKDTGIVFSKDYVLPGEELKITFQSGKLNGMEFAVTFNPCDKEGGETPIPEKLENGNWNPTAQVWEIIRNEDYGRELPGDVLIPKDGDKYVLSGWDASKITELGLVAAAELELKEKAEAHRDKVKVDPSTYTNRMMCDKDFMPLDAGARVNLINKAFFETGRRQSRIIGFEYNLDIPYDYPVYTVGETASYSRIAELESKIESVTLKGQTYTGGGGSGIYLIKSNDTTPASDSNTYSAKRIQKEFEKCLRKDKEDSTDHLIGFNAGITIGNNKKQLLDIIRTTDTDAKPSDTGVYSSLMSDHAFQELEDKYIRKDQPDSTLYPVDFTAGLSINSKRIGDVIRYYDEDKPVATDANIYSALQTDQRIEEEFEGLDDKYLRKDKEDTAHKHITFEEGITVYQLAELMNLDVKNLATIAKAVVSILRSSKFVDGFSGEGYQIWQDIATGDWNMTLDRLTVRKVMIIYELVMQKIRSVGGMVVVSAANGKVKSVERIGNNYLFTFEDTNTFQSDDLMRCQVFSASGLKYYWVKVSAVSGENVIVPVSEFAGVVPSAGDECVLMGNTTDKRRQNLIIISATEDGQPRFDCLNGVKSKSFEGCLKVRVGNLDGISDSRFPADMQPSGHGLYGNNCYLTGIFVLSNGKDVLTMFSIMEGMIRSEITAIRHEINSEDNYLDNASFAGNLSGWSCRNDIRLFSVSGRLLCFNNNFYADKRNLAAIVMNEGRNVLRLKNNSITQRNSDFARHPEFESKALTKEEQVPVLDEEGNPVPDEAGNPVTVTQTVPVLDEDGNPVMVKIPRQFYISFNYMVTRPGTLTVFFENEHMPGDPDLFEEYDSIRYEQELSPTDGFRRLEIAGKWNGKGDFHLSFTGDMYLYSLALADNPLAEMEEKFSMRFEATEKKIQANLDEIRKTGFKLEEYHSEFLITARNMQLQFFEDLSDTETRITNAYRSYVTVTAEKLEAGFKSDLSNAEKRITEAYGSAIEVSAKGLRVEFTADLSDMEKGITEAYKSHVKFTAESLEAGFETDLTDLRTGLTEAYNSAIEMSAKGLRTEFNTSIDDLDGKLTTHQGSFHVTAEKIQSMVTATDNISNTIKTAGWITTAEGNTLWATISTVNDISEELTTHEGSFHVTADKIEGMVTDITEQGTNYSKLTQTVSDISAEVNDVSDKYASLKVQVGAIGALVGDGTTGSFSEFQQTVDRLTTQVAENKTAAAGALSAAQDAARAAANAQDKAGSAYDKATDTASALVQTNESLSAIVGRFDKDGHLIEGAGWVTTTDAATLYARAESVNELGKRMTVAEASITTFITRDEAGELISSATIQADRINFTGKTIINGKFEVDLDGNLTLNDITTNNLTLSGYINGGNATLNNIELNNITANEGTFNGTVNADRGTIGGFKIANNGLTNEPFTNDAYVIFRNDYYKCFAGIGGNVLPSTSGMRAVGRFENEDTHDQWGIGRNIALLLSAKNGKYNHAFCGEGNGTLNGWIGGYKYSKFNLTSANTIYNGYSNLKDNNRWIIHSGADGSGVTLPRLAEVREALGIGSDTGFCVEFTILADLDSKTFDIYGRNGKKDSSGSYPWKASDYPNLVHWNNDHWDSVTMYAGDSLTVLLIYDSGKSGSKGGYPLTYTARVINRQD